MRRLGLALPVLLGLCGAAAAQGCGQSNPNCIVPTVTPPTTADNRAASTAFVQSAIGATAGLLAGNNVWTGTNSFGTNLITPVSPVSIWTANADPSLIHTAAAAFTINGTTTATGFIFGVAATSPFYAWVQVRNWFSDNVAGPLALNPLGGGVEIYTTGVAGGNTFLVQVANNWSTSTYWGPRFPNGLSGGVNLWSNTHGPSGLQSVGRASDVTATGGVIENISSYCFGDVAPPSSNGCWAHYTEGHRMVNGALVWAHGEFAVTNRESHVAEVTPFGEINGSAGTIMGAQYDCGNGAPSTDYTLFSCSAGIVLLRNLGAGQVATTGFAHGIVFFSALDSTLYNPPDAIALPGNTTQYAMSWWSDVSHRAWLIYSNATQTSTNNLLLANNLLQSDAPISATVTSGDVYHRALSGTIDMRMGANSLSGIGYFGTINNAPFAILINNSQIGAFNSVGLSLAIAGSFLPQFTFTNTAADNSSGNFFAQKSRSGGIITAGDGLFSISAEGHDGNAYQNAGQIIFAGEGTPGAGSMPGQIQIYTTASGSVSPTLRIQIHATGQVAVITSTDASSTSTGSVITAGGLGVAKQIYAGLVSTAGGANWGFACFNTSTNQIAYDTGSTCLVSVAAAKDSIRVIEDKPALDAVLRMPTKSWHYKWEPNHERIGFIADDLEAIDRRLVSYDGNGALHGDDYNAAVTLEAGAIRALKSELDELKRRLQ